uniref:Nuclear pore complex protein Nup50 (Trinotate prediction) n=1 Tax=Myxobolus squamalis TaxID=59785 RepID=A0A6B2GAH3_MYXSQ
MGYEPSAICSIRAKLFYLKNEKYCEIGVGIFNIKAIESDSQHLQLIFRLESSRSGSVLMNIKITKKPTNVTIQKDKNLIITSLPNPPIQQVTGDESFSDQMLVVSYLVKTKTVSDMKNILDAINLDF